MDTDIRGLKFKFSLYIRVNPNNPRNPRLIGINAWVISFIFILMYNTDHENSIVEC